MKTRTLAWVVWASVVMGIISPLFGQSLGEIARKFRAERAKETTKPIKVYTNDNLPETATISESAPSGQATEKTPVSAEAAQAGATATEAQPPPSSSAEKLSEDKKKTQEYWRGRFKAARADVDQAQEELRLNEDELGLLQMQETRELDPEAKTKLGGQVTAKQAEVDSKRQAFDKAKQALADLEKEFEESGAPADWMKTD